MSRKRRQRRNARASAPAPATVIVWSNGIVSCFDDAGRQLPRYQGPLARVRRRLAARLPEREWYAGRWPGPTSDV